MSIVITNDIELELNRFFENKVFKKIMVLVDNHTIDFCLPQIQAFLPEHEIIRIEAGEENKNLSTCEFIWSELTQSGCSRNSLLINLGGGVIGDMGGFCAATYKRGMHFLNLPTTLLAQVDATVGGKLGIDFQGLKNHIGVFQDPDHIIIFPKFLSTLPERELKSGFAEVIKHSLIQDHSTFEYLERTSFEEIEWEKLIRRSIQTKSAIVKEDPKEAGLRKILNFGHTIGHSLESFSLLSSKPLLHGEAVVIGMLAEANLSYHKSGLPAEQLGRIANLLDKFYQIEVPKINESEFLRLISQDKKNTSSSDLISFSLLSQIGKAEYDVLITKDEAWDAVSSIL